MKHWLLTLYRIGVLPLGLTYLFTFGMVFHRKLREGITMRLPNNGIMPWLNFPKGTRPIWFHCSSGEFEYAKPLIREFKQKHPEYKILVTYFSPSYRKAIESDDNVDFSCPLPWDTPSVMKGFIAHHRPRMLLISRTDFWPELLHQCQHRQIPAHVFSMTFNKSKLFLKIMGFYYKWLFSYIDKIFCVSEQDQKLLESLGVDSDIVSIGDTRWDQVFYRLENAKPLRNHLKTEGLTLIAGSTWPKDHSALLPAIKPFIKEGQIEVIIAPHEPSEEHLKELIEQLRILDLPFHFYSKAELPMDKSILIVDQVGVLAELYSWADIAFIGGSFRKSVHSVMEALATGCLVCVGPKFKNNREAVEFSKIPLESNPKYRRVQACKDMEHLFQYLNDILDVDHEEESRHLFEIMDTKKGASHRVYQLLSLTL